MDIVVGGEVMTSASYRMIATVGQGPSGNGVFTSTDYHFVGGLVGATQ